LDVPEWEVYISKGFVDKAKVGGWSPIFIKSKNYPLGELEKIDGSDTIKNKHVHNANHSSHLRFSFERNKTLVEVLKSTRDA
jgi:putative aminopeptidase FrvX